MPPKRGRRKNTKRNAMKRMFRRKTKLALKAHNFVERVEDEIALNANTLGS